MSRSWQLFLQDIEDASSKIQRYTAKLDFATFVSEEMAYDAVLHNLLIVGEAAKGIPEEIRQQYPAVDWRGMAGLRDVLAHAYFALDDTTLWEVVNHDVPHLFTVVRQMLKDLE